MKYLFTSLLLLQVYLISAQSTTVTAESKLHRDTTSMFSNTTIGGYGNAVYKFDFNQKYSNINLDRFVLFVGHKFNKKISLFSELEVEDAKVSGGEEGGEVALEQCYLKFNCTPNNYFVAGLFIPRIGILNEDHLPNNFFGNERTQVETFIIPSTWRELGIGYLGNTNSINYSVALVNGLNSASFEHGNVIRDGRFEGREATANNLAVTGALQFYKNNFKAQVSGYYGGSVGLSPKEADSLQLTSGFFGTPIIVGDANVRYESKGFSFRALGTVVSIADAQSINRAYESNTPELAYGAYAEAGYDLFKFCKKEHTQQLFLFARYETLDMNSKIPENGIIDGTLKQQHLIAGINYLPVKNVAVKADVRMLNTGDENPELTNIPSETPYQTSNTFLNLGIGFSF